MLRLEPFLSRVAPALSVAACLAIVACDGSVETGNNGDVGDASATGTSDAGSDGPGDSSSAAETGATGPFAGTWTYKGAVGGTALNATLVFGPGEAFQLVEQLAPIVGPPGLGPPAGCATTDTYLGTYVVATAGGESMVTWAVTGGTVNAVLDCDDAGNDVPGSPMTPEDVSAYESEGLAPPTLDAYSMSATTLTLTAQTDSGGNSGFAGTITFTRSP